MKKRKRSDNYDERTVHKNNVLRKTVVDYSKTIL